MIQYQVHALFCVCRLQAIGYQHDLTIVGNPSTLVHVLIQSLLIGRYVSNL